MCYCGRGPCLGKSWVSCQIGQSTKWASCSLPMQITLVLASSRQWYLLNHLQTETVRVVQFLDLDDPSSNGDLINILRISIAT